MARHWTFGQKIGAGFAVIVGLAIAIGAVAIYALGRVVDSKDAVITGNARALVDAEHMSAASAQRMGSALRFLLTKDDRYLDEMREARTEMLTAIEHLRGIVQRPEEHRSIDPMERNEPELEAALTRLIELRRSDAELDAVVKSYGEDVLPKRQAMRDSIDAFVEVERRVLDEAKQESTSAAAFAIQLVVGIVVLAIAFAGTVAWVLTRTLGRQIGTAVGHVQSSSSELQAAANQQATGAKEQSTAMSEITTTISEMLASSRQIAESAQRVAQIAEETAGSARAGEGTIEKAHDSIAGIRRQVDLVVEHMLALGKKSQEIGSILEIVSELAEQTNILAINATIEAAGAGDSGKRFAVVADEIRKLADRVADSTKEIRGLIDDVRSAVNTTVMATEIGSKAADAGSKQFGEVAVSFRQIAQLVSTTTEAAQEIELSTKQQASAVEQVNVAVGNVAQTTRETEASSSQTLQTASQLANLSRELQRLVQPQVAA